MLLRRLYLPFHFPFSFIQTAKQRCCIVASALVLSACVAQTPESETGSNTHADDAAQRASSAKRLIGHPDAIARTKFAEASAGQWQQALTYNGTEPWQDRFFLDGKQARLEYGERGMAFHAGPKEYDDAHHAVLWTKEVYEGDIKVEYEYTRLDDQIRNVTILYLFAQGVGTEGYEKDILTWAHKRETPKMRLYFEFMEAYQISYAAFPTRVQHVRPDYIRARRYMPGMLLKGTEMQPDIYANTDLFVKGVPHQITAIKKGHDLFFRVENADTDFLAHWDTRQFPDLNKGRVGLRHMYTRSARYRNLKISTIKR